MSEIKDWPRVVAHVDMDSFFASIEQRDFPELRGIPVAITNGMRGSCVITRSYEARVFGIKTGMHLKEAKQLCPTLVQRATRPETYAEVSSTITTSLQALTPDIEIFSVDEAFLEFTQCRKLYKNAEELALKIKRIIWEVSHLTCSVGISGDKSTAKFASKRLKPNGFLIIPPQEAEKILAPIPVTDLCGVAKGIARFLAQYGVYHCGDMKKIPVSVLARRFGNIGRRIWMMAQGKDIEMLKQEESAPKTLGHGKVMPPNTQDKTAILMFLNHMAEKVAYRLRKHQLQAQQFFVGIKLETGWIGIKCRATLPTNDGDVIYNMTRSLIEMEWHGEGVFQCQVTALDPMPEDLQGDLFAPQKLYKNDLNHVMDAINERYGMGTLTNGIRMHGLEMPDVIAPAWRPTGHRSNIYATKDRLKKKT
jgi:DNA polymerase-4